MQTTQFLKAVGKVAVVLGLLAGFGLAVADSRAAGKKEGMTKQELAELRTLAKELLGVMPDKMPGSEGDTKAMIKLGEKLYFEKKLSMNESQSCNSCHMVDKKLAGVDNEPTSPGAFGKRGDRNSPTVLNAGFQFAQFWDGRAADLVEQAKGPVLNPVEMAMPDEKLVLERLRADKDYVKQFKKVFPDDEDITYHNVARAIAAFERTLITNDRLDDFQKGKDKALTEAELKGLNLFLTIGCTTCHNGPVIGGNSYQKVGLLKPYPNTKDEGRLTVTKDEDDKFKFKVPMLRNVALTGPYFHDGAVAELGQVVRMMASMQLGRELTDEEADSLVAFLHSLSDKKRKAREIQGKS